jgi:hypothetical protein
LQTGGSVFGATKARSKSLSSASSRASSIGKVPNFSPFSPITWTTFSLICPLIGNSCLIVKHLQKKI